MKRWLALILVGALALTAYVGSGPYRTMRAIRVAVQAQDAAALSKQVDFPSVRASLKAQLSDRLVRKAGPGLQSSVFAALGLRLADSLIGPAVDTMVTPLGLGAIMEGRKEWAHASSGFAPPDPSARPADPLHGVVYRYESTSRFTATINDEQGIPTVFVVTRSGLDWRLSDIRLPPVASDSQS
ncbi:DUF2939 domain-containing protein [Cognatiluteimonas profundi]|uniref:DUF2939 domain-containing protein n=1 Tax=Cognatiluteimonas profundi TaxID=2594501 RepID=UPI00131C97A9|nr:DUF2939 domain-containing protein [Lysobacter profundi]